MAGGLNSTGPGILPAMHETQEARPRARSPFAAAFLSLLFPGLGQWYAGATMRALAFAAAPILLIALLLGVGLRMDRIALLGLALDPNVLNGVFVLNVVALIYRVVAIVDAYRVAEFMNAQAASGDGRAGRARIRRNPASIAGLLAVLLVMATSHVVVGKYDMYAMELVDRGCDGIFIGSDSAQDCVDPAEPTASPIRGRLRGPDRRGDGDPTPEPSIIGTPVPNVSIAPWDGKERLNILLIGADEQGGGHNTDTLITVSIDPVTKQVAMFSLPRDTVDVPIPPGPARQVWGRDYGGKINSFFANNRKRSDLWPGNDRTRGYNALKSVIGELYGLDIKYFVEVNFDGFRKVVDSVGGVTINVQIPVSDDRFPGAKGKLLRVYIPTGIQHMDGAEALRYARSRHSSTDFDRGQRQQRVLLSLREQADPQNLIPRLPELIAALKKTVRTDVPARPDGRAARPGLGGRYQEHPLLRVRAAALLAGHLPGRARLRRHPEHRADQGRRQGRLHGRSGGRGPARDAGHRGCRRVGPQRDERARDVDRTSRASWTTTGSPRRRRARSRRGRSRRTRGSSSSTAPRPRSRKRSPTSRRPSA